MTVAHVDLSAPELDPRAVLNLIKEHSRAEDLVETSFSK
jgi:hypothetical protein